MSTTRDRVDNDFYATPFNATKAILDKVTLHGLKNTIQIVKLFQQI